MTPNDANGCRELWKIFAEIEAAQLRSTGALNWAAAIRPIPSTDSSEAPLRSGAAFSRL